MSLLRRLRQRAGALIYDWPSFERRMRGPWLEIRNRHERIETDGRGVRCCWRYTSDLHIANVFPVTGKRLLRRALATWPITLSHSPAWIGSAPRATFVIGHRGIDRLPHLLQTLRSIAAQTVPVECVVVEQSTAPEITERLPTWVRHIHTKADFPYARSWAFNVGARTAQTDVLILHDNDMLVPAAYAAEVLQRVADGFEFVDLKRFLFYIDEAATASVFARSALDLDVPVTVVQNAQGGSVAARREAYFAIGAFDESFIGWGGEDNDFRERAGTRGRVYDFGYLPFLHLFHPPQSGKFSGRSDAVERYRALEHVPPRERIEALLGREVGRVEEPSGE